MGRVLENPDLRRLEIAWTLSIAAQWALLIGLLVYSYDVGGSLAVGVLGVARMLPTLVGVPLATSLGDRHSRARLLLGVYLVALASAGVAAVALARDVPVWAVFLVAAVNAVAAGAIRPLQNALLPSLARAPEELIAANVATSGGEAIGVLVGPAVGGVLIAFGPAVAAMAGAAGMLLATVALTRIRTRPAHAPGAPAQRRAESAGVSAGFAAVRRLSGPFLVMAVFGVQPFIRGALTVLSVVTSIELLGLGEPGVGLLSSAIGVGGIVGAFATIALIGRSRMVIFFALGLVFWGLPIAVIGLVPAAVVALLAMGVVGASNAVLDVAGFTLLQRTIPNDVRARVLGLFEGYVAAMFGLGGIVAPLLLGAFGTRGALIVTGAILPVLTIATWRGTSRADALAIVPERQLRLLRGVPMFQALPITVIEQLADSLTPLRLAAGDILMLQGEPGDRFVLVESGTLDVEQDGIVIRSVGPGGFCGEIALLRGVPRTATVRATSEVAAFALDSASFVAAVTGDQAALGSAQRVVEARLANAAD